MEGNMNFHENKKTSLIEVTSMKTKVYFHENKTYFMEVIFKFLLPWKQMKTDKKCGRPGLHQLNGNIRFVAVPHLFFVRRGAEMWQPAALSSHVSWSSNWQLKLSLCWDAALIFCRNTCCLSLTQTVFWHEQSPTIVGSWVYFHGNFHQLPWK